MQHHGGLIQSLKDSAQNESVKLLAKVFKSSSENKKSLVSLIEAKETEIGETLKKYVQSSNLTLANKIDKLTKQKEKEFNDPQTETRRWKDPPISIPNKKNTVAPSKETFRREPHGQARVLRREENCQGTSPAELLIID